MHVRKKFLGYRTYREDRVHSAPRGVTPDELLSSRAGESRARARLRDTAMTGSEETDAVLQFADDESDQASGGEAENYSISRSRSTSSSSSPCLRRSKRVKRARLLKQRSWSSCGGSCAGSCARGRRWKPYYKRSFEERKKADAKEVKRATRVREKLAATGQPLAPYNTTQFLMKDHELEYKDELNEELKALPPRSRTASFSAGDDESMGFYYSSPSDEEDFVNDDFVKQYGSFNTTRLSEMSVADLILECTELNRRIEILEDQAADMRKGEIPMSPEEAEKITVMQREISRVTEENLKLRQEIQEICLSRRAKAARHELRGIHSKKGSNAHNSDSGVESNYAEDAVGVEERTAPMKNRTNEPLSVKNAVSRSNASQGASTTSSKMHSTAFTCELRSRVITGKLAKRRTLTRPRRFQFRTDARAHVTANLRRETHEKLERIAKEMEVRMMKMEEREVKKIRADATFKASRTPQYLKRIRKERLRREKENRGQGNDGSSA